MKDIDKAELIQWLAARGYGIQSISDGGAIPGAGIVVNEGTIVQTKATTITITTKETFVAQ